MGNLLALAIEQRGAEFCVIGDTGRNMGCYPTEAEAQERLGEIERYGSDNPAPEVSAQLAIDLESPIIDRPGARRAWLDLTREGVFAGYPTADGAGIEITRATLEHLLASIKRAETPIPVDGGGISAPHEMVRDSGAGAAGWLLDSVITEDKRGRAHLWGWVELMPEVAQAIASGALLFGSVAYDEGGIDRETGDAIGPSLHSYALTNKPFVPGLHPHRLDRDQPGRYRVAASIEAATMIRAAMEVPSMPKMTEAPTTAPDPVPVVAELAEKLAAAQATITELQAKVAAHEATDAQRKAEADQRHAAEAVEAMATEHGLTLSDEGRDHLVQLAAVQGPDAMRATVAAINSPPVGVTMSDSAPARRFASTDDAITALSADVAREKPEANHHEVMRETLRRLSKNHPELV